MRDQDRKAPGFTLIELMIVIAIMAIVAGVPVAARNWVHGMNRESDYRFALRNARQQVAALRRAPFGALPPQVLPVPHDGWIQLAQRDLVPESTTLRDPQGADLGKPLKVDAIQGRVQVPVQLAGRPVVVDYRFFMPDRDEAHTVPKAAPFEVPLANAPAVRVTGAWLARGDRLEPVKATLSGDGTRLALPAVAAGRVVVVDYVGSRIRNQVSGRFLGEDLQPAPGLGPVKLLKVQESYGEGAGTMALTLLRVQP